MNISKEEMKILENVKKTTFYLYDALAEKDYDSAKLELAELKNALNRLEELKIKRDRKEKLFQLIHAMRDKGIVIDFATRSPFLKSAAKNAGEISRNSENNHKKRQQA